MKTRSLAAALAVLVPVLAAGLAGLAAAKAWSSRHWRAVTGRTGTPARSCLHCHSRPDPQPVSGALRPGPRYVSPEGLAVSKSGRFLYVAGEGGNVVLKVDAARGAVVRRAEVPGRPHAAALFPDGRRLAVTSRDTDEVRILDADSLRLREVVKSGEEPTGLAVSGDGDRLFVANSISGDLHVAGTGERSGAGIRLLMGNDPYAVAYSPAAELVAVANRRARPVSQGEVPVSEVTLVDARRGRVLDRRELRSAHLSEGVAISADGSFVLATALRVRNLLPTTQVARGAIMNSALVLIETKPGGKTVQFPLSEVNRSFADPAGVVLSPDGRRAFVAHGGSRDVTVVDVRMLRRIAARYSSERLQALQDDMAFSRKYVRARLRTEHNPRKLALSPDGSRLYVSETLNDTIAVFDARRLRLVRRIALGGPKGLTFERMGARTFFDASATFQGQFSCRSCHPDGHSDGLIWDFEIDGPGRELLETRTLRGIKDTAPFKWRGKNPTIHRQCGPRFAAVLTRAEAFEGRKLDNLVRYIESIPVPPKRLKSRLAASRERGRELFFRHRDSDGEPIPVERRCSTCHAGPLYTDRLKSDVGTGGLFDNPHLTDLRSGAPYLHDGRALSVEEIWTVHDSSRTHGHTADMNKAMLNDLVTYLRSL